MNKNIEIFDENVSEYEDWFDRYPYVFQSEVEAVREMLPEGESLYGIEIGLGTGQYSAALNIKEGVEPSDNMRALARKRGLDVMNAVAESLPYKDMHFDFAVILFSISYFQDVAAAFEEAHRILKNHGCLIVGFLDKDSVIGKAYTLHKADSTFYRNANFYGVARMMEKLRMAGFRNFKISQTLFGDLESISTLQPSREGSGEGSFVVIRAEKKI